MCWASLVTLSLLIHLRSLRKVRSPFNTAAEDPWSPAPEATATLQGLVKGHRRQNTSTLAPAAAPTTSTPNRCGSHRDAVPLARTCPMSERAAELPPRAWAPLPTPLQQLTLGRVMVSLQAVGACCGTPPRTRAAAAPPLSSPSLPARVARWCSAWRCCTAQESHSPGTPRARGSVRRGRPTQASLFQVEESKEGEVCEDSHEALTSPLPAAPPTPLMRL